MSAKMNTPLTHYEMTLKEHQQERGSYVDPDRYKPGHRDQRPEMLCHTGDGHARGGRNKEAVTCPVCLRLLGGIDAPAAAAYHLPSIDPNQPHDTTACGTVLPGRVFDATFYLSGRDPGGPWCASCLRITERHLLERL